MASTLQQQLAAIAANSTHQLDLKVQKARHGKSLLFDSRDAASQNFDTIFQICWEGFEELCQLDARFVPFGRTLFSEQSKSEDRTQMTAKESQELDAVLERFLGLVGSRLLLKPAVKATEWLVRRFRVQEYNTETVLLTFLPYHSAPIFATLLSILPNQLPPTFRFLQPYVASLLCPPRHAVVTAVTTNATLFTAFGQNTLSVAKSRHHSALVLGFWASITAQAIDGMVNLTRSGREAVRNQKEEDLLLRVLPVLQTALNVKGIPELYLASCVIITILATKTSLQEKVIDAMMEAVAAGWVSSTIDQGLTCLAILAEEKQQLALSDPVLKVLFGMQQLTSHIELIATSCRVSRLLVGVAIGAINAAARQGDEDTFTVIQDSLDSVYLSSEELSYILQVLLRAATELSKSEPEGEVAARLRSFLILYSEHEDHIDLVNEAVRRGRIDVANLSPQFALLLRESQPVKENTEADELDAEDTTKSTTKSGMGVRKLATTLADDQASFLDKAEEKTFEKHAKVFTKLSALSPETLAFEFASIATSACTERPAFFTFLARVWTSDTTASARSAALSLTSKKLKQISTEGSVAIDFQVLITYLISALADEAQDVRSIAASACHQLSKLYEHSIEREKPADDTSVWHKDAVYGSAGSQVLWLTKEHAHTFLCEAVLPVVEDCVLDGQYIIQALAAMLDASQEMAKPGRKELKTSLRTSVAGFLATQAVVTPVLRTALDQLDILSRLGKVGDSARATTLLPYGWGAIPDPFVHERLKIAIIKSFTHRTSDELDFLQGAASTQLSAESKIAEVAFARLRHLWRKIKPNKQNDIADWLLDLGLNENCPDEIQTEAIESLREVALPTLVLAHLLERLPSASDLQEQPKSAKRQRNSRLSDTPRPGNYDKEILSATVRRITLTLELIEASKPEKHPQLLKGLFKMLSELYHYKTLLDSELIYIQGLLINSLLAVVNGLNDSNVTDIDRSVVRADLIVECVRTTSSTQVHHAALLLMSALASWAPDLVLHSVMPLFTFMSSTILKQGDDYSAHVTEQTVTRIIPPLAASLKKRGKDLITGAAELLLSFTAAFEHIPLHRRAGLFHHLVQTLGSDQSLFAVVAMLIERYPEDPTVLPFVGDLMDNFPVLLQLEAVKKYLALTFDTTKARRSLSDVILGFAEKNPIQAKEATETLLAGLAHMLARDGIRRKLLKELRKGGSVAEQVRSTYAMLLQDTMDLTLQLSSGDETSPGNVDEVLRALLGIMPTPDFIDTSAELMQTGSDEMRRQVFTSLEQRASSAKRGDAEMQKIFIDVLPNCSIFIDESQPPLTRCAAIACIDHVSEKFGKTNREAVLQAAQHVAGPAALGSDVGILRVTSLLCLASMVEVLGDEFVPILPEVMDQALRCLAYVFESGGGASELSLHRAAFSFAIAIIDHVAWMVSDEYLDQLLGFAAKSTTYELLDVDLAHQFCLLAAKHLPAPASFSAIHHTWGDAVKLGLPAVRQQMNMLEASVQHHAKSIIKKSTPQLFAIMMEAFNLRAVLSAAHGTETDFANVYSLVDKVTMEIVLKLDDTTFRPFFIDLVERAADQAESQKDPAWVLQCSSLYGFALTFFDQLKSLVTNYYGYLMENTVSLLGHFHSPSTKVGQTEGQLLTYVLQTLTVSFRHDQDGFWQSPAHFDAIMNPLVSLLTKARVLEVEEHVIPAITEMAVAVASAEHYKTMNMLIMSIMRHEHPVVRLAAVKCERSITEKLGLDWLALLPEMLPFISELQEDDDAAVEREVLRWNAQIEGVTGESLENMLR